MNDLDIKKIGKKLGVSQVQLAEMVGVHARTIQNWESGHKIPESKHAILHNFILKQQSYTGEGEQTDMNGNNMNESAITVNSVESVKKLMELLSAKEASLAKAQEHIDKLLEIIGNITKGNNNG